ncbi:MAG TPA: hypothetical protein VFF16_07880 [Telluria sp.]|nr:hypothetical protein [Telluria sp.]
MATTVSSVRPTPAAARPEPQKAQAPRQAQDVQAQRPQQQAAAAPRQGQETQHIQKANAAEQAKAVQTQGFVHRVEQAAKAVRAQIQGKVGANVDTQA